MKHLPTLIVLLFAALLPLGCKETSSGSLLTQLTTETSALPLEKIKLPPGFSISVFAENIPDARSLALAPNGVVFIGNRQKDKVYAVQDTNGDYKADKKWLIAEGLTMPCGVAFLDGHLYVAEVNRILRFNNILSQLDNPPSPEIIRGDLPTDKWHGWKYIAFGPDGKLYVPVGAPCNVCEKENPQYATIMRMNPDGSELEVFAKGIRNSVGFDWHPQTGHLWFTNNGRDEMGDDVPADELNAAPQMGIHFGFPYCHAGDVPDPNFGKGQNCNDFVAPKAKLGAHVAALGMEFYQGEMFPAAYQNQIIIAEHGSWNRSSKVGYRLTLVQLEGDRVVSYEPFATGWLQGEQAWGRPVDLEVLPDGSMLVSDDFANAIYRITYTSQK